MSSSRTSNPMTFGLCWSGAACSTPTRMAWAILRRSISTQTRITKDFVVDDAVIAQLRKFLDKQNIKYTDQDIQQHLPWLKWEIKREVFTTLFGLDAGYKVALQMDPQLDKGIASIPEAKALYARLAFW